MKVVFSCETAHRARFPADPVGITVDIALALVAATLLALGRLRPAS